MSDNQLLRQIIKISGLAPILSEGVIRRACGKADIPNPHRISRIEVPKIIPHLRIALNAYLGDKEASKRLSAIEELACSAIEAPAYRLDDESLDED